MQMPEKDPGLWAALAAWLAFHSPTIYGAMLAMAIAFFRVIHGGGKLSKALLGGVMCGLLSMALINGAELVGLSSGYAGFVGGMVGFIGADTLREAALKMLGKKVDEWSA